MSFQGFAQQPILTFDFAGAAGNEATWPSNFNDPRLDASTISRSPSLLPVADADRFNSLHWSTGSAIDLTRYVEFTITPQLNKSFSITQVIVRYHRNSTGPVRMVIRTSADNFASNMGGVAILQNDGIPHTKAFNFSLPDQEAPVTIRIYAYKATYWSTGQFGPGDNLGDDIIVNGTTASLGTTVQFANTASSIAENGGPVDLVLSILHADPAFATTATISATDPDGRITSFTSPVVFPMGSSADELMHVVLNDDAVRTCPEDVVFTITGVTGGPGAAPGINNTHTLTVTDDDVLDPPVATDADPINSDNFTATWNAVAGASGYYLDVSPSATFGGPAQLVSWTFPNGSVNLVADGGLPVNSSKTISTTATGTISYPAGISGSPDRAVANNDWSNGNGAKWWQIDLSTQYSYGLTLSSVQRSQNTGPRDFKVQYRVGLDGTWTDVPGSTLICANNWTSGVLNALPLPTACENQPQLFLRWIMSSNTAVNGSSVSIGGTNTIDNISVDAVNSTPYLPGYENLSVGNVTSYPVTGLFSGSDYYYRVRSTIGEGCGTSDNSNIIHVRTAGATTYYSQSSGGPLDAIWSDEPVGPHGYATWSPSSPSSMVVQNGHTVTNSANVFVSNITVNSGGTLVLDTLNFIVKGDVASFNGALVAEDGSKLIMQGPADMQLHSSGGPLNLDNLTIITPNGGTSTDATINIRGTLQLGGNGTSFDVTAGNVTLTSTAAGTGRLGSMGTGTSYIGDLTVQRYIPAGATNWRMLGSPVAGQTIGNWADDFYTAGFPGSNYPNFYSPPGSQHLWPSIRWYNEPDPDASLDSSLVGVSGTSQALTPGQGFFVWSGSTLTTTTAFTVSVTGAPNIAQTPITLPMSFTNTGHPIDDGLNMVSNPLPSPIEFTKIDRGSNVANMYWIFDPSTGNTLSWSNGAGQGGANGTIQSSQGFWIQATGAALTTTVKETSKSLAPTGGVFGGAEQPDLPILHLALSSDVNGFSDEATVVFADGSPAYGPKDAAKLIFASPGAPQISVRSTEGYDLAIDFHGAYTDAITIPVMARATVAGTYTITANMAGIQSLSCMTLEDLATGTITPLTDGASYSFNMEPTGDGTAPRFLLHASAPLPLLVVDPLCGGDPGQATVTVSHGPLDINWTDAFGNVLLQQAGVNGNAVFNNIPAGNYAVHVTPGGACGELVADFSITAPPAVEATVDNSTPATCPNSPDGLVDLTALGGTAPYGFLWSNGSTDEDLVAAPGTYTVTVTDSLGCIGTTTATITGEPGTIAGFTTNGTEVLADQPVHFTNTTVLGNNWDWDFGDGTGSTSMDPVHEWAAPGSYTVTLTATGGDCSDQFSTDIHVASATGIADNGTPVGDLSVWADPTSIVIDHAFGKQPVQVDVYDATGRLALTRQGIVSPDRITVPDQELGGGVWFVRVTSGNVQRTFRVPLIR